MLAQARQIHHEGIFEFPVDFLLDAFEVVVLRALGELAAENFLPVRSPLDLLDPFTGDRGARPGGWERLNLTCCLQMAVIEVERFVIVIDFRQVGIGEDLCQDAPLGTHFGLDLPIGLANPAAVPGLLVFPVLRVADTGLGFDVVEPGVFNALPVRPDVLAGYGAGMAPDAFVEVQHHADLSADFHSAASLVTGLSMAGDFGWSSL